MSRKAKYIILVVVYCLSAIIIIIPKHVYAQITFQSGFAKIPSNIPEVPYGMKSKT